jgi:hypothetical protein
MAKWFAEIEGQRIGPYDQGEIEAMVKAGELPQPSRVWTEPPQEQEFDVTSSRPTAIEYETKKVPLTAPAPRVAQAAVALSWKTAFKAGFFGFLGAWCAAAILAVVTLLIITVLSLVGLSALLNRAPARPAAGLFSNVPSPRQTTAMFTGENWIAAAKTVGDETTITFSATVPLFPTSLRLINTSKPPPDNLIARFAVPALNPGQSHVMTVTGTKDHDLATWRAELLPQR